MIKTKSPSPYLVFFVAKKLKKFIKRVDNQRKAWYNIIKVRVIDLIKKQQVPKGDEEEKNEKNINRNSKTN